MTQCHHAFILPTTKRPEGPETSQYKLFMFHYKFRYLHCAQDMFFFSADIMHYNTLLFRPLHLLLGISVTYILCMCFVNFH